MIQNSIKSGLNSTREVKLVKVIGSEKSSNCAREPSRYSHSFKPAREEVQRLYESWNWGCDGVRRPIWTIITSTTILEREELCHPLDRKHERS
jgi:hypothetical protein